jgi:2-oxo-3-hexenedioate decarboxylase
MNIEEIARRLDDAARARRPIEQFSGENAFDVATAYQIQQRSLECRYERGERAIGIKLGFTSRAKMDQMGVDKLIWGPLTDAMARDEGGRVPLDDFIHPRVEPEICFITKRDIDRPLTLIELHSYIDGVAPAIEIIDSRYNNLKFSLPDVIADNCSSSGLVVGPWSSMPSDISNLGVVLCLNGQVVQSGSTASVLGNPLRAVVMASQLIAETGGSLPAGSLLMSGGVTAAEGVDRSLHVSAAIASVGRVEFDVT